jgi:hypothetical protein
VTNVGGTGRTVIGKIKFTEGAAPDFKNGMGIISTPTFKFYEKSQQLKTDAERKAFYQSPEVEAAYKNHRGFSTLVSSDGSFRAEDVLPGTYEFDFQPHTLMDEKSHTLTMFNSTQEVVVPEAKDQDDDSSVDWGEVELKKFTIPIPEAAAGKK